MNKRYEQAILKTFETAPRQTVSDLSNITGIHKRTVQRYLKELVEDGKVHKEGAARSVFYERVYNRDFASSSIVVILNGDIVGLLEYGQGEYLFAYDDKYQGKPLPGLLKDQPNKAPELFAVFENLIPEHSRREKLLLQVKDIADVLLHLDNAHGAFDFVKLEELFKYKSKYSERPSYSSVKAKVLGHSEYPNVLDLEIAIDEDKLKNSTSTELSNLSGYQHKIDVTIDWDKKVLSESWESDYLLKPMNRELSDYFNGDEVMKGAKKRYYPLLALNEHLFMSFAKNELGFDVPYSGIVSTNYDFHYIVKRYDRYNAFKYNHLDFGQLLGIQSKHKYDVSSEKLFEKINETLYDDKAKREALKFYFYSYLIKHSDLHVKNISALEVVQDKYLLSPLYDVISVGLYNGEAHDLGLSFTHPVQKPVNLRMNRFYQLAKSIGISKENFKKDAYHVMKAFIVKMPEYIQRTKKLESTLELRFNKTRNGYTNFSDRLESMYQQRIIVFKKLGVLEELGLLKLAGGPLNAQKISSTSKGL